MLKNFKIDFNKISAEFKALLGNKWIQSALLINIIYLIISSFLTLTVFRNFNDFSVYYNVGGQFINDISDLYNPVHYKWAFRYFPLFGLLFIPYYLLGFELGFIMAQLVNFIINFFICFYVYKIILLLNHQKKEINSNGLFFYLFIFLVSLPQLYNYILGQINLYVSLLIIISLFLFIKNDTLLSDFTASFFLGLSTILKPFTLFIIPFLLLLRCNLRKRKFHFDIKRSFLRFFGVLLPIGFNFIIFITVPGLWNDFININLVGGNPIDLNHSFSLTKLIINALILLEINFNQIFIILPVFIVFMASGFIIYIFRRQTQYPLLYGYILGILIMLLAYFDSWDHHLLILTPLLIICLFTMPKESPLKNYYIEPSFFFFSFLDFASLGLWYLLADIFPFNFIPTIFLLICFISISKYILHKDNKKI
ncbi:MAG: DUF2029 domain-containing protein [Promethearchaeota archaeon]|nr:MAG: DUF2029 domain-containing protein [Candidatus Lokiarchaeota archaeon]